MEFPVADGRRGCERRCTLTVTVSRSPLRAAACLVAAASTLALAGCMGSPTYGTDKTANAQLLEDLSSSLTLGIGKR